jgi:biopolymer transport protein ExbB
MNSIASFIKGGGIMMYPLIFSSIVLVAIVIERAIALRKAAVDGDALLDDVKAAYTGDGSVEAAIQACKVVNGPLARIFTRGIRNAPRGPEAIELALELESANEQPSLEANLPILKTIVNIAPLLGLLGTIAGMITSFRAASQAGLSNPTQILGGISEALISTATGITLAVLGFLFYNYYANLAKKISEDMEYYSAELVNVLTGRIE